MKMAVLIMTPDMSAETWDGAAGCASGNQTCNGMIPAFVPKPKSTDPKSTPCQIGERPARPTDRHTSKSNEPVALYARKRAIAINTVPSCVMSRYMNPARIFRAFSRSKMTRK